MLCRSRKPTRGFALIEVLIAAALMAMVVGVSLYSFYGVSRGLTKSAAVEQQLREAKNIAARLRVEAIQGIENTYPNWEVTERHTREMAERTTPYLKTYKVTSKHNAQLEFVVEVFQGERR